MMLDRRFPPLPTAAQPATQQGMTRTQQTAWIVGAIIFALVAFMVNENRKEYEKEYPGCWQLIGEDNVCEAQHLVRRMRGY